MASQDRHGRVYWIWAEGTSFHKLGFTSLPIEDRLAAMQASCPIHLKVIARVCGTMAEEKALHRLLKRYRLRRIGSREWYSLPSGMVWGLANAFGCQNIPAQKQCN